MIFICTYMLFAPAWAFLQLLLCNKVSKVNCCDFSCPAAAIWGTLWKGCTRTCSGVGLRSSGLHLAMMVGDGLCCEGLRLLLAGSPSLPHSCPGLWPRAGLRPPLHSCAGLCSRAELPPPLHSCAGLWSRAGV